MKHNNILTIRRKEACLVCGEELEYFAVDREMECVYCHQKFMSKVSCKAGHYVCDACHAKTALQHIEELCMQSKSKNPIDIAQILMSDPYVHMHGNEHHTLVGAALLTAYHNCGGNIELSAALAEMQSRGSKVPGGVCGFWGCCGSAISTGMFMSIVTKATPLTNEPWGLSNKMTSKALASIGEISGPRCCKRNTFLSIQQAALEVEKALGIKFEMPHKIVCTTALNKQCIGLRCPFNPANHRQTKPKEDNADGSNEE